MGARKRRPPAGCWGQPHAQAVGYLANWIIDVASGSIPRASLLQVDGVLHRAMYDKHLNSRTPPDPLYHAGGMGGRRYTPRGGPLGLYLSLDPATPAAELRTVLFDDSGSVTSVSHDPITTFAVHSRVSRVLDLTNTATRRVLTVTVKQLKLDWEDDQTKYLAGTGPMPPTQLIALAAHITGLVCGIKYRSVRTSFGVNLVVFPDRLDAAVGDALVVTDSSGRYSGRLP